MPQTRVRVVGSGFSSFNWRGQPIAYLDSVSDSGQAPVANAEAVQPLGALHPVEIATARAVGAGELRLTLRELWDGPAWTQLAGLAGTTDIIGIFNAMAADPSDVTCQMIIKSPNGQIRGKTYHNCVVINVDQTENLTINALSVPRVITVWYTHFTPVNGA